VTSQLRTGSDGRGEAVVEAQQPASASREEMERLALIHYQLDLALRQAEQAQPLNGFNLLGFQDAVESFLHLAAEHIGFDTTSDKFMDYEDGISTRMPDTSRLAIGSHSLVAKSGAGES
jgi:hypothetical protein